MNVSDSTSDTMAYYSLWRPFGRSARRAWLVGAYARTFGSPLSMPQKPTGTVVELDGRLIDGFEGFFCAIGEAVNGPGGYFGKTIDGFSDCAMGGFGVAHPWTLKWRMSAHSREALGYAESVLIQRELIEENAFADDDVRRAANDELQRLLEHRGPTLFDTIVRILEERGINVELL